MGGLNHPISEGFHLNCGFLQRTRMGRNINFRAEIKIPA